MSGRPRRQPWAIRAAAALVVCVAAEPIAFQESTRRDAALTASLAEGFAKIESGRFEDARTIFEGAVAQAVADGNVRAEAEAYRGLGRVRSSLRDFASGREAFERALALFDRAGDDQGVGRVWNHLGADAYSQSRPAEARQCYDRALEAFRRAGLPGEEARVLRNLVFLPDRSVDEKLQLIAAAVDRARLAGAQAVEGLSLHTWGDLLFGRNDYAGAMKKLEAALPLLEASGSGRDLARLYTSFGRLFRIHGDPARALTYYEHALERQRVLRDLTGEIQTLNAIALALSVLHRDKEAAARYEDALSLARSTGSRSEVGFILQQFGIFHVDYKRYARGAPLLEEALTLRSGASDRAGALTSLAEAYQWLRRPDAARAVADQAVAAAGESGDLSTRWNAHAMRAELAFAAGHIEAALDDVREGLRLGERLRPNLLPADAFRRGFAERRQSYFDFAVSLMMHAGHVEEALAASEQGRSRAFLDLLASQAVDARPADPELKSFVAAEAPSMDTLRATAARLTSTVVSYWVTPRATFAWVVTSDGTVRGRRIRVPANRLRTLVRGTWALPSASSQPVTRGTQPPAGANQDRLTAAAPLDSSYRELYDVLVRPLRHWFPRGDGRLLTIVPHGPLLRLSFAALQNERGKYLIEGYRLHYTPALSVLQFTARDKRAGGDDRLLLIASPSPSSAVTGETLPPLPGATREADAIARTSRGARLVLAGTEAREARIRETAAAWTTIHFAAHGIVSDERPLTSYLALAGSSRETADDGRLTAAEIYGLNLRADLVVLSACRTAGGRVTGDGIVGLTRAFMYAGAASVVAPVWDLIDETTPQLFETFYAARDRGAAVSAALRDSQLQMLRALRAGSVAVNTAAGRFVVPEHPSIWGGLQLWGEP